MEKKPQLAHCPLLEFKDNLQWTVDEQGKQYLLDPVRRQAVVGTNEEVVRQLMLQFLIHSCALPMSRIAVEKAIVLNDLKKRYDIVVYDKYLKPLILVECKSFEHKIQQSFFDQGARYNMVLRVPYLVVTNGEYTYLIEMDYELRSFRFLREFPIFSN